MPMCRVVKVKCGDGGKSLIGLVLDEYSSCSPGVESQAEGRARVRCKESECPLWWYSSLSLGMLIWNCIML